MLNKLKEKGKEIKNFWLFTVFLSTIAKAAKLAMTAIITATSMLQSSIVLSTGSVAGGISIDAGAGPTVTAVAAEELPYESSPANEARMWYYSNNIRRKSPKELRIKNIY